MKGGLLCLILIFLTGNIFPTGNPEYLVTVFMYTVPTTEQALTVSAIMYFGICGAILGTIAALVYRSAVTIYYSNKKVLARSTLHTYRIWIINGCVFAVVMLILYVDTFSNMSFTKLVINGIIHSVWIVALYSVVSLLKRVSRTMFFSQRVTRSASWWNS